MPNRLATSASSHPWYVRALLVEPDRVLAHLAQMRRAGIVDDAPNAWQLSLGVLRLWARIAFRSETVGTSAMPVRDSWRARLLAYRALRLPCLLASGAVIPFDFTGLRSSPARLVEHVLGAHHDGVQVLFDLELLAGHGRLDDLAARVAAVLDGSDPRARWLRDLTVYAGYHEALAAAVARGPVTTASEARDPDLTLRGLVAWCARQPATPHATLAAWSAGRFALDICPATRAPTTEALVAASPRELAGWFESGHPVAPDQLADREYRGTSLGLPRWIDRLAWKTFTKVFVADADRVRGWNVRVDQAAPWTPRERAGVPWTFGHFAAVREGEHTLLDYGRGGNRRGDPIAMLRDPVVSLASGSADRLLGRSLVQLGSRRAPTPSYFLLEYAGDRAAGAHVSACPPPRSDT
ncbi:MAG: hypothetical protein M3619_18530 [Myxococcota bacterium]|nr:hypothetical protein [Myxococcota bacterium]